MTQLSLLDGVTVFRRGYDHGAKGPTLRVETPAARSTDPETSQEAADQVTSSGKRGDQQAAVLHLVRHLPGRTAGELAAIAHFWIVASSDGRVPPDGHAARLACLGDDLDRIYHAIQRRVSELAPQHIRPRKASPRRRCTERETTATELWPAETAP